MLAKSAQDRSAGGRQLRQLGRGGLLALALCSVSIVMSSCTTGIGKPPKTNLIVADEQGRPLELSPHYPPMALAKYDLYLDDIFSDLERYCQGRGSEPCRVLLFFHGGLNSHDDSVCRAEKWQETIRAAGFYPIFVSWDSSFPAAWWDHVAHVHQGVWTSNRWVWASPYVAAKDELKSIADTPLEWMAEIRHTLPTMPGLGETGDLNRNAHASYVDLVDGAAENRESRIDINDLLEGGVLAGDDRTLGEKVAPVALLPFTLATKLLAPPLIIEGAGSGAWDIMRRRTYLLFRTEAEAQAQPARERREARNGEAVGTAPGESEEIEKARDTDTVAALAYFITRMQQVFLPRFCPEEYGMQRVQAVGEPSMPMSVEENDLSCDGRFKITLVGHSMGAIIVDQLLRYAPMLPVENIVFMAGATTVEDYKDTVEPFLEGHPETQMYHLILHPGAEVAETNWLDLAPRGSLLVWIDNYFTDPVTRQERTVGRFLNLMPELTNTPNSIRAQVHVKVFHFGADGQKWNPQKHGDFSIFPFWDKAFWNPEVESGDGAPERLAPPQCDGQ